MAYELYSHMLKHIYWGSYTIAKKSYIFIDYVDKWVDIFYFIPPPALSRVLADPSPTGGQCWLVARSELAGEIIWRQSEWFVWLSGEIGAGHITNTHTTLIDT